MFSRVFSIGHAVVTSRARRSNGLSPRTVEKSHVSYTFVPPSAGSSCSARLHRDPRRCGGSWPQRSRHRARGRVLPHDTPVVVELDHDVVVE